MPDAEVVRITKLAAANGHGSGARSRDVRKYMVRFDEKGKLVLPDVPAHDDAAGQSAWLTAVFSLNPAHPITGGEWRGPSGPEGQIALLRAGAPTIRIEPARHVKTPMRLLEAFTGRRHPGDGMLHAFKADHCRAISYVVECLCDMSQAESDEQQAVAILGTFLQRAEAVEGLTTYGTTEQRYEAAIALRGGQWPYCLIDDNTGEYVIAVSDLADAARRHVGSSLPRGWLDTRMALIGWQRIRLDGHAERGRAGRTGHHATINAYRGHVPSAEAVTK